MQSPFSLEERRILVTGASSGIGRCIAIECSKVGAKLVLVARRENELRRTLESLEGGGHVIDARDLTCTEALAPWLKDIAKRIGAMDGLVHAAGEAVTLPLRNMSMAQYSKLMALNLDAAYWLLKGFRQPDVHRKPASFVLVGSVTGVVGESGMTAYSATKGALVALAKSGAAELASSGIRVNCLSPGYVQTELLQASWAVLPPESVAAIHAKHLLGIGQPEDVAWAAVYLLSDAARWITGANVVVDGGYTAV